MTAGSSGRRRSAVPAPHRRRREYGAPKRGESPNRGDNVPLKPQGRVFNDITETIGGTPLVRINRLIPPGQATVLAKCEFFNPLASVKDRIGAAMIEAGERG